MAKSNLELLREVGKKIQSGETRWNTPVPAPPSTSSPSPSTPGVPTSTPVPAPQGYSQQVRDSNFSNFQSDPNAKGMVYDDWLDKNIPKPQPVPAPTATTPTPTVNSAPTVTTPSVPTSPSVPAPPTPQNTIDTGRLQAEASAQISKRREALNQSVQSTLAGLKNSYDYSNQLKNDQRTLENVEFKRNTNPFSGKTDYLTANMNRNRTIQDTAADKDYQAQVSSANQKLADFDSMAPEQQQALYNELLRMERDYGLQVGNLTGFFNGQNTLSRDQYNTNTNLAEGQLLGNYKGQRTLAGSAQDATFTGMYNGQQTMQAQNQAFQQQMALADLMGQYNGQSTLQGKQANLNAALALGQRDGKSYDMKQDWGLITDSNAPASYQAQQDAIKNNQWQQQFDTGNSQWQQQFDYNKTMDAAKLQQSAQQFAQQMGYNWAKMSQDQQQFLRDMTLKQYNIGLQQSENKFNQGMQAFKETGVMPDFMSQYGISTAAINNEATKQDVMALYDQLAKGGLTPKQALKTIDDKVRIGAESVEDGETMKQAIYTLYPDLKQGSSGNSGSGLITVPSYVSDASNSIIDGAKTAGSNFLSWWGKQWANMLPK